MDYGLVIQKQIERLQEIQLKTALNPEPACRIAETILSLCRYQQTRRRVPKRVKGRGFDND